MFVDFPRFMVLGWVTNWAARTRDASPFIRGVRTASGATSVQIMKSRDART